MIHFSSDQHYSHKNICRFTGRPFESIELMNRMLIEYHNAVVQPTDIVYYLGDFAFCPIDKIKSIMNQLNGTKFFCAGNHDKELLKNRQQLIDGGYFKDIRERIEINYEGQFIVLNHYGMRVWNKSHYDSWHLFGHSHNSLPPFGKSVDVGVDSTWVTGKAEYRPFSFNDIKRFMDKQKPVVVDPPR